MSKFCKILKVQLYITNKFSRLSNIYFKNLAKESRVISISTTNLG